MKKIITAFIITVILLPLDANAESQYFPVPELIRPNVNFWIRIYTEVGLQEGLLHDRDHPQVTYEKVISGSRTGKARSDHIDARRQIYVNAIHTIRDSTPDKWGAVERRVAELFNNAPAGALDSAEFRIRHQTGQRERFRAGLERSGAYIDTISAILRAHNVPDELKYLPHVESSFDSEAYSKAGAAGLWQFMRGTGRGYMKVDYMFDERRDPIISTYGAAKFLRANYEMLQAWPLAVTAYNHGPNGMRRAVESVGSRDIAVILQRHESPSFKFASRNFYSCFVAVLEIMENVDKYFRNVQYRPRFEATNIRVPFAMTPNVLMRTLNVSERDFKRLNPSFRPVMFTQQRQIPAGHAVNLPVSISADSALAMLNNIPATDRTRPVAVASAQGSRGRPTDAQLAEGGYHTVERGDNLYSIARRAGITISELAAANNITNSSKIYVGQVLRIPGTGEITVAAVEPEIIPAPAPTVEPKVETMQTTIIITPEPESPADSAPPPIVISWTPRPPTHRLTSAMEPPVALAIPLDDPRRQGREVAPVLSSDVALRVAEVAPVVTPSGRPTADTRFDALVYDLGLTVNADSTSVTLRVSVDETIGHFSEWMRVDASEIRRANRMSPNASIRLGQRLTIPASNATRVKRFETNRLQYHMALEEDFFARYNVVDFERYTVKSGDNLWNICRDAQIPMWLLKKYNRDAKLSDLMPGANLWIPKVAAKDAAHEVPSFDNFDD